MASVAPRSLRAARAGYKLRFDLGKFHSKLGELLSAEVREPGKPGGCEPDFTVGPREALGSYLLSEFLSKFDDGLVNTEKELTTWKRFHEAEALCFDTNQRLSVSGFRGPYEQAIELARNLAGKILGRFSWDDAEVGFGWGPGASTRLPRTKSDAAYKYSGNPESTIGNAILANTAICRVPSWQQGLPMYSPEEGVGYCKIVPGNRIVTVPKNYKTDRTIAIEPDMNMYVQKGLGSLMRKRLRLAGCDLDDQTRNQRLARVGSFCGTLATIDLSMASDTVSRVLVQKFIREDWLSALEMCRSPFGVLPSGEKIFYQKFSSMGCGFTFELESLVFLTLALAWTHLHGEEVSRVSVYGDDIIIPSAVAGSFCGLLQFCGFKTNEKKSYWSGPFRESCGKHFFHGHEISPFYVKRPVRRLTDLFLLHNNLYRWLGRSRDLLTAEERLGLREELLKLRRHAPSRWRKPRLPDGNGDGAFIGQFDELNLTLHPGGWECWVVSVLASEIEVMYVDQPGLLTKGLHNIYRRPHGQLCGLVPRPLESIEVYPVRDSGVRPQKVIVRQYALGY